MRNKYKIFVIVSVFIITLLLICASQSLSMVNTNTNDALTKARIKEIKSTKNTDISKRTGKIYYVSSSGNDYFYNGLSESTPWQSIDKVNNAFWSGTIKEGDTILFRRGDYFRGSLSIEVSDITLGSYGDESKPKPIISASTHDGAKEGSWVKVSGNVWKYTLNNSDQVFSKDIGNMFFFCKGNNNNCNYTTTYGDIKYSFSQKIYTKDNETESEDLVVSLLKNDLEMYHIGHASGGSASGKAIYLYSVSNPATRFDEIEFNVGSNTIHYSGGVTNLVVDNLDIRHAGRHGIGGGTLANLYITNSEIYFIGGSTQYYNGETHLRTRLGNGVEIYGSIKKTGNYEVEKGMYIYNTYVDEVYDAGVTFQYTSENGKATPVERVEYDNNVIENCNYDIEYWNEVKNPESQEAIDNTYMNKIYFTKNILRKAGYGFNQTRHNKGHAALIKAWDTSTPQKNRNHLKSDGEYIIENNIFDSASEYDYGEETIKNYLIHISAFDSESLPIMRNNKFYNYENRLFGIFYSQDAIYNIYATKYNYDGNLKYNYYFKNNEFFMYEEADLPASASGTSGSTTWNFNPTTRTLTISGSGDMKDYTQDAKPEWYQYKKYIANIVVGENVTYIGKYAFHYLEEVQNITINSKTLKDMKDNNNSFTRCGYLSTGITLTFGENVTIVPKNLTFSMNNWLGGLAYIKRIYFLGNKVTEIHDNAFIGTMISEIMIPESVTTLGESVFSDSKGLRVVVLPNSITKLGVNTFKNNTNLESIYLGMHTNEIDEDAILNCPALKSIYIPSSTLTLSGTRTSSTTTTYTFNVYAPISLQSTITSLGLNYNDISSIHPKVYSSDSSYTVTHNTINYGNNTSITINANNKTVKVNNIKYRYIDSVGRKHLFGNLVYSNNTISNMKLDVEPDVTLGDTITSTKYTITNHKIIVKPTTLSFKRNDLVNNIYATNTIKVYSGDTELKENTNIGTNTKVRTGDDEYSLILMGDATGDGIINIGDVSKIYNYYKSKASLTGDYLKASDVTNDSSVNLGDVSKLYNFYKGKTTL